MLQLQELARIHVDELRREADDYRALAAARRSRGAGWRAPTGRPRARLLDRWRTPARWA
ncbi:hypothetical protein [Motilibacter deserti]|uniref:Uncharacterized protein n=1 Tax=Motilibacter deserti TaxID=2714956 RepID=A0ABX0GYB6_9ACTN|nr:hypothetical protein [Motilibacter deserti]NHC14585.1 hypothetical protein [Motilibacter deserti]